MNWFLKCLRHYVDFEGRARRAEYWYFVLFGFLFALAVGLVDGLVFGLGGFRLFSSLYCLFIFLPQLAVSVRRLHDIGRSGWIMLWYYVSVFAVTIGVVVAVMFAAVTMEAAAEAVPLFSGAILAAMVAGSLFLLGWAIFLVVLFCTPGQRGPNRYGADPLEVPDEN